MRELSPVCRPPLQVLAAVVLGALAGWGAAALRLPLPWMLGPLFAVAVLRVCGVPLKPVSGGRQFGQWAIGTAIGLGFTPAVLAELVRHAPLITLIALTSVALGLLAAAALQRWGGVGAATAFFAGLPGGASEMVVLAQRMGGATDRVAAAHALRVLVVVSLIPFALQHWQAPLHAQLAAPAAWVDWSRFPLLVAVSLVGVALFLLLKLSNPWILGALLGVGTLTACGVSLTALPGWLVNAAQLLLGLALGCRFSPDFFRAAPRFMAVAASSTALILLLAGLLVLGLGHWQGLPAASLLLAAAPGGMAEMGVTARELGLSVPMVTATHVIRVVLLTLVAPMLCRHYLAWRER